MQEGKTKATSRNMRSKKDGSVLNANHVTLEATREGQSHIDQDKFEQNVYWRFESNGKTTMVNGGTGGFNATKHEIKRYKELFGKGQEAKNDRYIKNRNKKNCRTVEQLYRNPKTAPLESLWQIGNSKTENIPTHELRLMVFQAWRDTVNELRKEYGDNLKFLDAGLHMEEAVPHIHSRMVLGAKDEYGYFMPNQNQAFKEMGIERPDLDSPQTKYNSPLIAFSDMVREKFYQNCEKQGLVIDREVTSHSHRQKELLELQCERMSEELKEAREAVQRAERDALEARMQLQEIKSTRKLEEKKIEKLGTESKNLALQIEGQKQTFVELEKQVESKKEEVKETIKSLTSITDEIRIARKNEVKDPTVISETTKRIKGEKVDIVALYKQEFDDWKQQRQLVPRLEWVADSIDKAARKIEQTFQVDELIKPWKDRAERAERNERSIQIEKTKDEIEISNLKWYLGSIGRLGDYEKVMTQYQEQEQNHHHHIKR